jgi:hypothetical protein
MKKILYVVMHSIVNKNRYDNVMNTWGKNKDVLFYADYDDADKNVIKVSNDISYKSNEEKHINIIKLLNENNTYNYEWFFLCDDDTFVNTLKLEDSLDTFDPNFVNGSILNTWQNDPSLSYCSGGAGNLIHFKLLNIISLNIKNHNTGFADVSLGLSLRESNIGLLNSTLFNSQPPKFYNIEISDINNYISFHYLKTEDEMKIMLENI